VIALVSLGYTALLRQADRSAGPPVRPSQEVVASS
jgi:hypothetical protein